MKHVESTTVTLSVAHASETQRTSKRQIDATKEYARGLLTSQPVNTEKKATSSLGEEFAYPGLDGAALVVAGRTTIRLLGET
ncbi:MAG: hypothetical protein ACPGLY_23895 [Rubripirellula sp.]